MYVVIDLAQFGHDPLVGPTLEGSAQIDADDLAEDAGIDPCCVIGRECHPPSFCFILSAGREPEKLLSF
jgi:hypothetical protein